MRLVFDIESNGLLDATKIHSLCLYDIDSGKTYSCTDNAYNSAYKLQYGLELLSQADMIIGHNIICFDIPLIRKLYPEWRSRATIRDTLTLSRLIWTNLVDKDWASKHKAGSTFNMPLQLYGRHSLEAWGYRMGEYKGTFGKTTDWQNWTPEMQKYCEQDVRVTTRLWNTIQKHDYSERAIKLEHDFQKIIFRQEQNGFPFDLRKAEEYYIQLCGERDALRQQLQSLYPPTDKGEYFTPKRDNKAKGYVAGVPIWKPKITAFNPGSRDEIAERFKEMHDWIPTELTPAGKPKVDEEVLSSLPWEEAKQLANFFLLQKRIGQLGEGKQAWLSTVGEDGCIHGRVTTNGAVTGRCTHHDPNLAQVPAVGTLWGEEFRSLFYAPEGYSLLGCDASGLELRCLAHYMAAFDKGAYAEIILHGDIHWANALALGLYPQGTVRNKEDAGHEHARNKVAKRFIYAFLNK